MTSSRNYIEIITSSWNEPRVSHPRWQDEHMSRFARGELPRPSGFLGDHSKFIHSSLILVWLIGFDIFDFGFIFQIKSPKKWWPQRWTAAMPATSCRRFGVISQLEERRVDGVGPGQDGKHEYSHVHIMYIFKYEYMINIWELIDACLQHVYNILLMECLYSVCRLKILILQFLSNFYSYWWYILVGNV